MRGLSALNSMPRTVLRRRNRNRERKVPEQILPGGGQGETLRRGDDEIGFAELPALRQRGKRRPRGGITLRRASFDPLPDQLDLIVAKTSLVIEIAVAVFGQPRWHRAAGDRLDDLTSAPANRLVLEDTEGSAREANRIRRSRPLIDRPMTGRAVLVKNRRDVVIERRRRVPLTAGQTNHGQARGPRASSPHLQMIR